MRTKDEIMLDAHKDVRIEEHKSDAQFWLEVRKIEVLLDIRDIIDGVRFHLAKLIEDSKDKD